MTHWNPEERKTACELLNHDYFKEKIEDEEEDIEEQDHLDEEF